MFDKIKNFLETLSFKELVKVIVKDLCVIFGFLFICCMLIICIYIGISLANNYPMNFEDLNLFGKILFLI